MWNNVVSHKVNHFSKLAPLLPVLSHLRLNTHTDTLCRVRRDLSVCRLYLGTLIDDVLRYLILYVGTLNIIQLINIYF